MNYERGLNLLRERLVGDDEALIELATFADRLKQNLREERLFGGSDGTRHTRASILYLLNELAIRHFRLSFNDFCEGTASAPAAPAQPLVSTGEREAIERQLTQHESNLRTLREQQAAFGIQVPLSLINEIQHQESAIGRIRAQLGGL